MKAENTKLVAILFAIASVLAFAAALVTYMRNGTINYTALGGGFALAALAGTWRQVFTRPPR